MSYSRATTGQPGTTKGRNLASSFEEQRDYYAYLHNETIRQLNDGKTPLEIAEDIVIPPQLSTKTNLQGYYGSISHNVKGVYDKYMGWFDGNPANLWALTPADEATQLVKCMGGSDAVVKMAQEYIQDATRTGNKAGLRFAATLLNKVVFADASSQCVANLLSSVYTTLGEGAENGTWRNIYLTGAQELVKPPTAGPLMSATSLMALSLEQLFDTVALRIDGPRASKQDGVTIDFLLGENKQYWAWHFRLSNGAVTGHAVNYVPPPTPRDSSVSLTVWCSHESLVVLIGSAISGKPVSLDKVKGITTSGDVAAWDVITGLVVLPNAAFNIVRP